MRKTHRTKKAPFPPPNPNNPGADISAGPEIARLPRKERKEKKI